MSQINRPSPTELVLLKQVWAAGTQSARELHDGAGPTLAWSFSSTRKTLDRMVEKGLLARETRHGVQVYLAAADKVDTLADLTRAFLRDVLEIDGALPASTFVDSRVLDPDELDRLQALLDASKPDAEGEA